MGKDREYSVVPAQVLAPPKFAPTTSPLGTGCFLMVVAFFINMILVGFFGETTLTLMLFIWFQVGAITLTFVIYQVRKRAELRDNSAAWMRQHIEQQRKEASTLTQKARQAMDHFYDGLGALPRALREADILLGHAEEEFHGRAYAPFWDNIEQTVQRLGVFNSSLTRLEVAVASYKAALAGQVHNFPPLTIQPGNVPHPGRQTDKLRQFVRKGQTDFEFATIWEHRKTQRVIVEGFRTLGEAVSNLGFTIDDSFSRATKAITESFDRQREEQVRLRETFESAVNRWEEAQRRYGA
jgi:hypothetical protein